MNGHDVVVGSELSHNLCFPHHPLLGILIQSLCLYKGEGYISVENCVVGQVDLLPSPFAKELLNRVTSLVKGGGVGFRRLCL